MLRLLILLVMLFTTHPVWALSPFSPRCINVFAQRHNNYRFTLPDTATHRGPRGDLSSGNRKEIEILMEIEAAHILSLFGFRVMREPKQHLEGQRLEDFINTQFKEGLDPNRAPDFLIRDQIFDHYAPTKETPVKIANGINIKVEKGQARRIVLNLWENPAYLRGDFNVGHLAYSIGKNRTDGLLEVIVVHGSRFEPELTTIFPHFILHTQQNFAQ